MATAQAAKSSITLKGSADIVTEFFGYGINSILYQRGIYPPEQFERKKKYGLTMLVTSDSSLREYLVNVLSQLRDWLVQKTVQKVIIVISNAADGTTVERWQFDIECDKSASAETTSDKAEADIHKEIQGIVRQITASVTFLPVIEEQCVFEVLMYTDKDMVIPNTWEESDPKYVDKAQEVFPLRSFSTKLHTVNAAVMYREE